MYKSVEKRNNLYKVISIGSLNSYFTMKYVKITTKETWENYYICKEYLGTSDNKYKKEGMINVYVLDYREYKVVWYRVPGRSVGRQKYFKYSTH